MRDTAIVVGVCAMSRVMRATVFLGVLCGFGCSGPTPGADPPGSGADAAATTADAAIDAPGARITTFRNPLNGGPDPFLTFDGTEYLLATTQGDRIALWHARTLARL